MPQAARYAKANPDKARSERSVYGSLSTKKKIRSFIDLARESFTGRSKDAGRGKDAGRSKEAGRGNDAGFASDPGSSRGRRDAARSRSRMLQDVSHHNTSTNAIPKVQGEVRL